MEKTEMEFPHQGKKLTAVLPFYGPANSRTLRSIIRQEEYAEPSFPELTSFVHHFYKAENEQGTSIRDIMNKKYFVGFTGILYMPQKKGVYFFDKPRFHNDSVVDTDDLLSRLRLKEYRARLDAGQFESGNVSLDKIKQNPFFTAAAGEEGAAKLAEIASWHPEKKAYIFVPDISYFTSPQARIVLLYSYDKGRSLTVSLNGSGYSTNSFAFGLVPGTSD